MEEGLLLGHDAFACLQEEKGDERPLLINGADGESGVDSVCALRPSSKQATFFSWLFAQQGFQSMYPEV